MFVSLCNFNSLENKQKQFHIQQMRNVYIYCASAYLHIKQMRNIYIYKYILHLLDV